MSEKERWQRIEFLTEQIAILKRHQWPGIEQEIEERRSELRALLSE